MRPCKYKLEMFFDTPEGEIPMTVTNSNGTLNEKDLQYNPLLKAYYDLLMRMHKVGAN